MSHNGIDIDEYILLIIYPSIAFFTVGFISKKKEFSKVITYILQSIICFTFSIAYYFLIPRSGALGLALILGLFGILLLIIARKEKINPTIEEEGKEGKEEEGKLSHQDNSNADSHSINNNSNISNGVGSVSSNKIKNITSSMNNKREIRDNLNISSKDSSNSTDNKLN